MYVCMCVCVGGGGGGTMVCAMSECVLAMCKHACVLTFMCVCVHMHMQHVLQ